MPTWHHDPNSATGERLEEVVNVPAIRFRQNGESRNRTSLTAVVGWWNSPDTAPSVPQLLFLFRGVFLQPIRRIGDNRVDMIRRLSVHPFEAFSVVQRIFVSADLSMHRATLMQFGG